MALTDSIRAYYKFDSGALTTDSTGNGYTLTNKNTVAETASGKIGYGADNGTATNKGFFRQPTVISYAEVASGFTFNLWLKNDDTTISCYPLRYNVNNGSLERNFGFYFPQIGTPRILASAFDGAGHEIAYNTTLTQGAWYMCTLKYDGSTLRFYLNGTEVGSNTFTWSGYSRNTQNAFTIGMYMDVSTDTPSTGIKGQYDEVGVWARSLSNTEITELYNSGNGLQYPFGTAYTTERTETVTSTDTRIMSITRSISETVTNADTIFKNTLRNITETVTNNDVFSSIMIFYKELSESVSNTDTIIKDTVRSITESITNNDTISKLTNKIVSETTTITETITSLTVKIITLYETLTILEDFRMFLNSRVARWRDKYNENKTQDWVEKQDL